MNVKKIREDFPLLLANPDLTYLDSAATSQKPACVLRAEREFYECHNANPLRGLYELSENATKCYEDARKTVQHFIGAARPEEIIFTRNATESLNLVAYSLGSLLLKPGDEVVVSIMEHHSNLLPWQHAAKRAGAQLKFVECSKDGKITLEDVAAVLTEKTRIMAITQMSNVLGCVNDIKGIASLCHKRASYWWRTARRVCRICRSMCRSWMWIFCPFPDIRCWLRWESARCTASWSGWKKCLLS